MEANSFAWISPFNWLILVILLLAAGLAIKNSERWKMKERGERLSFGLESLLYMSGGVILLGCTGFFFEMSRSVCAKTLWPGSSFVTVVVTVTDSAERMRNLTSCYLNSATVMMTALLASMLIALVWFFFYVQTKQS